MNTSAFRGGYYSHGKQYIKNLRIPTPTDVDLLGIDALVADLIHTNDEAVAARTPHLRTTMERRSAILRNDIETRISSLFRLSEEDLAIIRSIPAPD